eukprot:373341_1
MYGMESTSNNYSLQTSKTGQYFFEHNEIDTSGGQGGAVIWYKQKNMYVIFAIHGGGSKKLKYNAATPINNDILSIINRVAQKQIDSSFKNRQLEKFLKTKKLLQYNNCLYHVLIREHICYDDLQYMGALHVEDICDRNKVDVETKVKLRNVISAHQQAEEQKYDHEITIVLIGDTNAGKTSLLHRFITNNFGDRLNTLYIGSEMIHYLDLHNGSVIKLTIWDTAGHEKFRSVTKRYYVKADVILYCFDASNADSLNNFTKWFE